MAVLQHKVAVLPDAMDFYAPFAVQHAYMTALDELERRAAGAAGSNANNRDAATTYPEAAGGQRQELAGRVNSRPRQEPDLRSEGLARKGQLTATSP